MGAEENELVVVSGRAEGCFSLRAFFFFSVSQSCSKNVSHFIQQTQQNKCTVGILFCISYVSILSTGK